MPWVGEIHAIWADSTFNSLITLPSLGRQLVLAISTGLVNWMTLPWKIESKPSTTCHTLPLSLFLFITKYHKWGVLSEKLHGKTPRDSSPLSMAAKELGHQPRLGFGTVTEHGLQPNQVGISPIWRWIWNSMGDEFTELSPTQSKIDEFVLYQDFHGRCFGMVADCWDGSFLLGGDSWGEQWDDSMLQDVFTLKTGGWLFKRVTSIIYIYICNPTSIQIEPFR